MNPIKAHLLDRLRPKDRTMNTITDEEATVLGSRAVNAGLRIVPGMKTLHARKKWSGGIVTGFIYDGAPAVSMGVEAALTPSGLVPDLRDPGTKGHAVAQLRERTNRPGVTTERHDVGTGPEWYMRDWTDSDPFSEEGQPTEEEAIVAAFEAIKETL